MTAGSGLFLAFVAVMGIFITRDRKRRATASALAWLNQHQYHLPTAQLHASFWEWPVRVRIEATDSAGQRQVVELKVGGPFGGTAFDHVRCLSVSASPPA